MTADLWLLVMSGIEHLPDACGETFSISCSAGGFASCGGMSYIGDTQSLEGGLQVLVCIAGKGRAASSTVQLGGMQPAAILPSFCKLYLWILKEEL